MWWRCAGQPHPLVMGCSFLLVGGGGGVLVSPIPWSWGAPSCWRAVVAVCSLAPSLGHGVLLPAGGRWWRGAPWPPPLVLGCSFLLAGGGGGVLLSPIPWSWGAPSCWRAVVAVSSLAPSLGHRDLLPAVGRGQVV